MEHSTTSQPPTANQSEIAQRRTQAAAATDERDRPHFRSLTMPGLAKGPIFPAWLHRLFRRKDTPATH